MKKMLLLAVALCTAIALQAQESERYPSYIQVTGAAEEEITPNEIYLSITINERDQKGRVSIEEQQRAMLSILKKAGVDIDTQLSVIDLSSTFFKRNSSLSTAQYRLLLHDAATVARVWRELDQLGISQVSIERTTHSELERYRSEVRQAAMRSARQKAVELAEAVGQQAGKCFYIYDLNSEAVPLQKNMVMMARGAMADSATECASIPTIEFAKITLTYRVQAKFVLE